VEEYRLLTLNDQVAHLFPTPRAADADKGTRSPKGVLKETSRGHGLDLPCHVQIFPTPTVHGNYNKVGASPGSGNGLETFVKLYPSPMTESGRHATQLNMTVSGSLNPDWVEWLQGLPLGWTDIGE
jgi:hypothetical protein